MKRLNNDLHGRAQAALQDLPDMAQAYPEGVDAKAVADWFGIRPDAARTIIKYLGVQDDRLIHERRVKGWPAFYIWPVGTDGPLPYLPTMTACLLQVLWDMFNAGVGVFETDKTELPCLLVSPRQVAEFTNEYVLQACVLKRLKLLRAAGAIDEIIPSHPNVCGAVWGLVRGPDTINPRRGQSPLWPLPARAKQLEAVG